MPNTHRRRRRDSAVELNRVGVVNGPEKVYNIFCAGKLLRLVTSDDMIMTSLLKKLLISIKIPVVKPAKPVCSVSKLSTESVGSRRELVANCVHTADADATRRNSTV